MVTIYGTNVFTVVLCEISFLFQGGVVGHVPFVEKVVILSRPFLGLRCNFMFYCGFSYWVADCCSEIPVDYCSEMSANELYGPNILDAQTFQWRVYSVGRLQLRRRQNCTRIAIAKGRDIWGHGHASVVRFVVTRLCSCNWHTQ